jgi:hypothetical protein
MNFGFRFYSMPRGYSHDNCGPMGQGVLGAMSEFYRSGAIMVMAIVVLAAGVAVALYG